MTLPYLAALNRAFSAVTITKPLRAWWKNVAQSLRGFALSAYMAADGLREKLPAREGDFTGWDVASICHRRAPACVPDGEPVAQNAIQRVGRNFCRCVLGWPRAAWVCQNDVTAQRA